MASGLARRCGLKVNFMGSAMEASSRSLRGMVKPERTGRHGYGLAAEGLEATFGKRKVFM